MPAAETNLQRRGGGRGEGGEKIVNRTATVFCRTTVISTKMLGGGEKRE